MGDDGRWARLERIASGLPEVDRVDVEAWGGQPTFRVRGKCFVFASADGAMLTVKLGPGEAAAVVATDRATEPTGYGLGRHGWVTVSIPSRAGAGRWQELEEWIRTSYSLVAPARLARIVLAEDNLSSGRRALRREG